MDLALLVPISPGARVGVLGPASELVTRTSGITVVALDGHNEGKGVDVLLAQADESGNVDTGCLQPLGWLVATIPPARHAVRRLRDLRRGLSCGGFNTITVFGAEPAANTPDALVPVDDPTQVRDLFRVLTPFDASHLVRARAAPALCRVRCQRFAFRSFVVVARHAP